MKKKKNSHLAKIGFNMHFPAYFCHVNKPKRLRESLPVNLIVKEILHHETSPFYTPLLLSPHPNDSFGCKNFPPQQWLSTWFHQHLHSKRKLIKINDKWRTTKHINEKQQWTNNKSQIVKENLTTYVKLQFRDGISKWKYQSS